jgi:hypothetical protein
LDLKVLETEERVIARSRGRREERMIVILWLRNDIRRILREVHDG